MDWDAFLAMNGYGGFVWPAYGVAVVVLIVLLVQSLVGLRRRRAALDALLPPGERRSRRRAESRGTPVATPQVRP